MTIKKKCEHCNTELLITENSLLFEEKKSLEIAYCAVCKKEVHSALTDGWFFVELFEDDDKKITEVTFPMA